MTAWTTPDPIETEDGDRFDSVEFNPPIRTPKKMPDNPFEIGLVLAGAVSAGAYIGGVMDFLIEALDTWQAERKKPGNDAPNHDVVIKVITGASGGGMNGGIAAAALYREFPHVRLGSANAERTGNPFFDAWVNDIDITMLLTLRDLAGDDPEIVSILDSTELEIIARRHLTPPQAPVRIAREYLADPLRLFLTTTNLRGVPYWMKFQGNTDQGHGMLMHRDHLRFALRVTGGKKADGPCSDEMVLEPVPDLAGEPWSRLAAATLATGAFPIFLKPREVKRPLSDYAYRNVFEIVPPSAPKYRAVKPSGSRQADRRADFLAVDGGTMNNEPLELARQVLAGAFGRNPRDAAKAVRATVLVDPFPEMPTLGPETDAKFDPVKASVALAGAWKSEARFRAQDLALAGGEDVYSRFLIAPSRRGADAISKGYRLTSEALEAFGGFLSRHFRVHDYLLGRRNCQAFLANHFALPKDHALFNKWSAAAAADYTFTDPDTGVEYRPIIPLIKGSDVDIGRKLEIMPDWPSGRFDRASIEPLLKSRFDKLYDAALSKLDVAWWQKLYLWPLKSAARSRLLKFVLKTLAEELDRMNL